MRKKKCKGKCISFIVERSANVQHKEWHTREIPPSSLCGRLRRGAVCLMLACCPLCADLFDQKVSCHEEGSSSLPQHFWELCCSLTVVSWCATSGTHAGIHEVSLELRFEALVIVVGCSVDQESPIGDIFPWKLLQYCWVRTIFRISWKCDRQTPCICLSKVLWLNCTAWLERSVSSVQQQ